MFFQGQSNSNEQMIQSQIVGRGISNRAVIDAMQQTDRMAFVPEGQEANAYDDNPVPLMPGATVSQPYIVALMTDLLRVGPDHRVLEVGTGSGYQAAVLALLAHEVYGVEVQPELVEYARQRLRALERNNVMLICGDGWNGFSGAAPYDRILVTAAPSSLPEVLVDQLVPGGRMVVPVGDGSTQNLEILEKSVTGVVTRTVHSPVKFVPLIPSEED